MTNNRHELPSPTRPTATVNIALRHGPNILATVRATVRPAHRADDDDDKWRAGNNADAATAAKPVDRGRRSTPSPAVQFVLCAPPTFACRSAGRPLHARTPWLNCLCGRRRHRRRRRGRLAHKLWAPAAAAAALVCARRRVSTFQQSARGLSCDGSSSISRSRSRAHVRVRAINGFR